ncbi:hypothetical protein PtA15_2A369 [Puccinia triticina]|uniref:Uncharacterized protein n=1 Tax=Puccinia triticina TaxID=208348 RepID=A0ABY7CA74_9BASI|nr:uncharacterized protein PtA15_2A369 [Puccinia triticina]WAQ82056.1 hypothetical protein PtA15_2A369 [Puccinia triticina]WAR52924.1 hypothetical protein PtB15_2B352 [Puccinia triticina]
MPRSNHPNMRAHTVNTRPPPRRNRTQRAWNNSTRQELEEKSILERDLRIGQRLGQIDAHHEPGVWQDINDKQPHHANFEPPIGSYINHDWEQDLGDLPSAAHASYHRAR